MSQKEKKNYSMSEIIQEENSQKLDNKSMRKVNADVIDLRKIFRKVWKKKLQFFVSLPIVFVLSCIYILSIPRYYKSELKLAPEIEPSLNGGTLGNLASNFGIDVTGVQSSDAISPLLYPDLMEDNGFVVSLFDVRVSTFDDSIKTTYYDYLLKHRKRAWWAKPLSDVRKIFSFEPDHSPKDNGKKINPYELTKKQDVITSLIRTKINVSVDKKDAVITIKVEDQDRLICKTMADTVKTKLQNFITDYRTNKARVDVEYYKKLTKEAWEKYRIVRDAYVRNRDANTDVILESVRSKVEDLENDMQLKYTAYTTVQAQLQEAEAKLQSRTPAFTLLKGASVPIKPAGPKRMFFVLGMLFLAVICHVFYIVKDDLLRGE